MVSTATTTPVAPRTFGLPEPALDPSPPPEATKRFVCPKCGTRLVRGYDEPKCPSCGFADYSYTTEMSPREGRSILGTATRYILRYAGDFPDLADTLAHIKLVRVRNRVVYEVDCPFDGCGNIMEQSSLSGKRPEVREQRYKCDDGHRVSLVPVKRNMLGWK